MKTPLATNIPRFAQRIVIRLFIFLLVLYVFKGFLYRNLVRYKEIQQRPFIEIENKTIKNDLNEWLNQNSTATIDEIMNFAADYVTKHIQYTFGKCTTNPNKILTEDRKTNCIGYSASLHAVVTYLINQKGLSNNVKSEHKVGHLYLLGFNIHGLFQDASFKDHDYNVITDKRNHKRYVFDPTLYANLGILNVTE
jgi:hypothetical protein